MASPRRPAGGIETAVGIAVLAALAAVAATIIARQVNYTSTFLASLDSPASQSSAEAGPQMDLLVYAPDDFGPMSAAETFGPDDLYEKIDGRADLYLTAGFVALHCRRLSQRPSGRPWMEVYVYDMGDADNAFVVYSKQKRPGAEELAELAYQTANSLHFVHGRYYVEIVAEGGDEAILRAMREYRQKFVAQAGGGAGPDTRDMALFPREGLRAGSISRASAEDIRFEGFGGVFLATYSVDGVTVIAFLARGRDPEAARQAAASYCAGLRMFAKGIEPTPAEIPGGSVAAILDTTKIVFPCGPFVAGVHESPNRDAAIQVARRLYDALAEAGQ